MKLLPAPARNLMRNVTRWLARAASAPLGSSTVPGSGGWWPIVRESFTGAWQRGVTVRADTVAANWAVFACVTLIANDIAKMPARVMRYVAAQKIWVATAMRPVLRRPNHFQTWPEFVRSWIFSLLFNGNTYVLKVRNEQQRVVAMYVLDPLRVTPLISPNGTIFYRLSNDNIAGIQQGVEVPASEIIHDRINTIFHPLVGVSPIYACGVAAMQSIAIQANSEKFFANMSKPGGVLTAPGPISNEVAERLKKKFEEEFSGDKIGTLLVLGDGLKYEAMTISAKDSQLIEQLKFTGEMICAVYHVPPYKLGLGAMPTVNNVAALNQQYYDQCLHPIIDAMERRLDDGLEIADPFTAKDDGALEVWFDDSELLRMDPASRFDAHQKAIGSAVKSPNEARREENLPPVEGGESPYLQQQNFSLAALAKRDAQDDPFGKASTPPQQLGLSEDQAQMLMKHFDALLGARLAELDEQRRKEAQADADAAALAEAVIARMKEGFAQ